MEFASRSAWAAAVTLKASYRWNSPIWIIFNALVTASGIEYRKSVMHWSENYLKNDSFFGRDGVMPSRLLRQSAEKEFRTKADVRNAIEFLQVGLLRALNWHSYSLAVFQRGWGISGHPKSEIIAKEFFDGNLAETALAVGATPTLVEALYPHAKAVSEINTYLTLYATRRCTDEQIISLINANPDLYKAILLALWGLPETSQRRVEMVKASSGCLLLLCAIVGTAVSIAVKAVM